MNEIYSESIFLTIKPIAVVIEEQPQPTLYVKEGDKLLLNCKANNHSKANFQWFRDNTKLDDQTSHILSVITSINFDKNSNYILNKCLTNNKLSYNYNIFFKNNH